MFKFKKVRTYNCDELYFLTLTRLYVYTDVGYKRIDCQEIGKVLGIELDQKQAKHFLKEKFGSRDNWFGGYDAYDQLMSITRCFMLPAHGNIIVTHVSGQARCLLPFGTYDNLESPRLLSMFTKRNISGKTMTLNDIYEFEYKLNQVKKQDKESESKVSQEPEMSAE